MTDESTILNRTKERRNRNYRFYAKATPAKIREFLTREDFYSSLPALIQLMKFENRPLDSKEIDLIHRRFISDIPASGVMRHMAIKRSEYNSLLKTSESKIRSYMEEFVLSHPIRIVILKMRDLRNKTILKKLFLQSISKSVTIGKYLDAFKAHHWNDGPVIKGYSDVVSPYTMDKTLGQPIFTDANIKHLNNLYLMIRSMVDRIGFRGHIRACEGTTKTELFMLIHDVDMQIAINHTKLLF